MGTQLHDKINSYSLERGIEFNEAYSLAPTRTGSSALGTYTLTNTAPVYDSSIGPIGGGGAWKFRFGATTGQSSIISSSTANAEFDGMVDGLFTLGFWFYFDTLPGGTTAHNLFLQNTAVNRIQINGTAAASNPSRLQLNFSGSTFSVGPALQAQRWYFLAIRRFANVANNIQVYLDGSLLTTLSQATIQVPVYHRFGATTAPGETFWRISNYFHGSPTVLDATAIGEIWTAGSTAAPATVNFTTTPATATALSVLPAITGSANNVESPATASLLLVPPTIVVTQLGEHVEVVTSIPVSAEFPPATVSVQTFVNIEVDQAEATVELLDNIIAGTNISVDVSAEEFLASAVLVKPFLSESPMIASAILGTHTVYVDPNYFNEVVKLNPYVYINNGGFGSAVNYGSQQGTFARGQEMRGARDGGAPLNMVREGLSWLAEGNSFNSDAWIEFTTPTAAQHPAQLVGNGTFAFEFWAKPETVMNSYIQMPGIFHLKELPPGGFNTPPARIGLDIKNGPSSIATLEALHLTTFNNWNHFVVNVYQSGTNAAQRLVQVWINGAIKINQTISFTPWTNTSNTNRFIGSDATSTNNKAVGFFDEIAWYTAPLTNSQITTHYQLISTLSPNYTEFADPATASAASGTHQFTVTSNAIPEIKEATASALAVTPTLIAGRTITYSASPAIATAEEIVDPLISLDNTNIADPMIAYAESVNAFHLNSIYVDYVKTNINPYRYVTFDSSVSTEDIGTDADYSVVPTVIGGQVVNPDEGINGKSAKTAGTSYVTDGVILKESEWNDTWGTGQFNYHSSFWMQKAPEDTSTGLRVLWNLNGYLDNQHVILFHRQNKLHMQFNNGSGTHVDATTVNDINIFDGERHFVVIAFDHTNNNNNQVLLYVDSILVLTVSLGSYTGQTINGTTFVGPNDEVNNHPRLGVGCLITPFGQTALPVAPTNTRIILDEIYWAKTAITQTQVTNLYNIMPDKNNNDSAAEAMTASGLIVNPAISTGVNKISAVATATALMTPETVRADRNIVNVALPATASIELLNAQRINNIIIAADVAIASAIFDDAGVRITIPGPTLFASATLASAGIRINGFNPALSIPPWAAYLRATDVNNLMVQRGVN